MKSLLAILSIWIRNDADMNEEDDEVERRSLPTKQIKISIRFSFHVLEQDLAATEEAASLAER